jgi:hypothetical protein
MNQLQDMSKDPETPISSYGLVLLKNTKLKPFEPVLIDKQYNDWLNIWHALQAKPLKLTSKHQKIKQVERRKR